MKVKALKVLRGGGIVADPGEEFSLPNEDPRLVALLQARAVEPVPVSVERAVEQLDTEAAVEAPAVEKPEGPQPPAKAESVEPEEVLARKKEPKPVSGRRKAPKRRAKKAPKK